jgi:hypothetical protein
MASRSTRKQSRTRARLATIGVLAAAAALSAIVASTLPFGGPRIKPRVQNPFDASRNVQ